MSWEIVTAASFRKRCASPGCERHAAKGRSTCWACDHIKKRASRVARGLPPRPKQHKNTKWFSVGMEKSQYESLQKWAEANKLSLNAAICSAVEYSMEA